MYDELVKSLRDKAEFLDKTSYGRNVHNSFAETMKQAADAIEQLSNAGSAYGRGWTLGYDAGREESKPRWIPVTERLPEDGSDILAFESYCGYERIIPANYDGGVWFDCVYNHVAEHITHWMPLPKPPKEK